MSSTYFILYLYNANIISQRSQESMNSFNSISLNKKNKMCIICWTFNYLFENISHKIIIYTKHYDSTLRVLFFVTRHLSSRINFQRDPVKSRPLHLVHIWREMYHVIQIVQPNWKVGSVVVLIWDLKLWLY